MYAHVVVDIPNRAISEPFDYAVPRDVHVAVGSPVVVPLGPRHVIGYVVGLAQNTRFDQVKSVEAVLGDPLFDSTRAPLARWIAEHYCAPLSEALRLLLPPGGRPRLDSSDGGRSWTLSRPAVGPVDDRWASLTDAGRTAHVPPNATVQRAVLDALAEGPLKIPELEAAIGSVAGAVRRLEALGLIVIEHRRRHRAPALKTALAPPPERLSAGQQEALDAIDSARPGAVVVLDGITGSGKTEVYLRAIEQTVASGRTAIVLIPEISLTPQTVGRFRGRFGDRVAVLHSRLSAGERFDQWDRVRSGEAPIVVGARSALFAPAPDLGLIVIDEEHEHTYKQGSAPRYHARDAAERLASLAGSVLVLGSATPSMETRVRCDTGAWTRVAMPDRVAGGTLPAVEVVDMGAEFAAGHRSMFSRRLLDALADVRDRGEKAVLFLNRRGFADFLLCRECGYVPRCDSCSVSLTYHEVGSRLSCHHCGATRPVPPSCPRCGSPYLRLFGAGTQRVETELTSAVPGLAVVRMDADTTRGKGGHERALATFEVLESGILLGTQMVALGLDYPDVTLVGVINADTTLHLPDFRAAERTYQLLEQVSGRTGRSEKGGKVVLQTYWPDHPAIQAVARRDPDVLYDIERSDRAALGYPPYGRIANVIVAGRRIADVRDAADSVADALRSSVPEEWTLLGPSPAPLAKAKSLHRWHVLLKAPADADISSAVREAATRWRVADAHVAIDIDPLDLM